MDFGEDSMNWCLLPHAVSFMVEGVWVHILLYLECSCASVVAVYTYRCVRRGGYFM